MFKAGQRVWHRDGRRTGIVLECDGDRVYIEQDNGAELEFHTRDLSTDPPAGQSAASTASPGARPRGIAGAPDPAIRAQQVRLLTARDITPDHLRVLAVIPVRTVKAVAALYERRPGAGRFSALDPAAKLNFITEVTAIPYRIMHQYSDRPGELGLLMGKGLADSSRGPS